MAIRSCRFRVCKTYVVPKDCKDWILWDTLANVEYKRHLDSKDLYNQLIRRTAKMEPGLAISKTQNDIEEIMAQQKCASELQGLERKFGEWWAIEHDGD
ncbi:MAG: hypothetical protein Q9176_007820 [Flavoplaca citrina]